MKVTLEDMHTQRKALPGRRRQELPANHPNRARPTEARRARRLPDDTYRKYLAFAEEIDARQVGQSTAVAVKERLGHQRSVEAATSPSTTRYASYQRAITALTAGGPTNPYRRGLRQQKLQEALVAWRKALEKMQRYEQSLANLTKPKTAPTSSGGTTGSP